MMSTIKKAQEQFPLGTYVTWTQVYDRVKEYGRGSAKYTHGVKPVGTMDPSRGVVVGCRWKRSGTKVYGYHDEPSHFEANRNGSLSVLLVRPGYSNKEIEVPLGAVEKIEPFDLPHQWGWHRTPRYRRRLSKKMKADFKRYPENYPRDSKGRFVKLEIAGKKGPLL